MPKPYRPGPTRSAYLLMTAIAVFGLGSAWLVLYGPPDDARTVSRESAEQAAVLEAPVEPLTEAQTLAAAAAAPQTPAAQQPQPPTAVAPADVAPSTTPAAPSKPAARAQAAATPRPAPVERTGAAPPVSPPVERLRPKRQADKTSPQSANPGIAAAGAKPRATPARTSAGEPDVRAAHAPLVGAFTPHVVAVTEDKAWVKVDPTRTVIVNKGESFQDLGRFLGPDGPNARFENATLEPSATVKNP